MPKKISKTNGHSSSFSNGSKAIHKQERANLSPRGKANGHSRPNLNADDLRRQREAKQMQGKKIVKVGIVGGGVTGLYSALYFDHFNSKREDTFFDYEIIESENRLGGRILTHSFDESKKDQYSDMGAMRLPRSHVPVFDLIDYVNFRNSEITKEESHLKEEYRSEGITVKPIEFFYDSRRVESKYKDGDRDGHFQESLNKEKNRHHGAVYSRFNKETHQEKDDIEYNEEWEAKWEERKKKDPEAPPPANELVSHKVERAKKPFFDLVLASLRDTTREQCDQQLIVICRVLDKFSYNDLLSGVMETYFEDKKEWTKLQQLDRSIFNKKFQWVQFTPEEVVLSKDGFIGIGEPAYGLIFAMMEDVCFNPDIGPKWPSPGIKNPNVPMFAAPKNYKYGNTEWWTPHGGMEEVIKAMARAIPPYRITKTSYVNKIRKNKGSGKDISLFINRHTHQTAVQKDFDKLIVTIPSAGCDWINWDGFGDALEKPFRAFRGMTYMDIFKIAMSFRERFWENPELFGKYAVVGGQAQTTLPSKQFVYPSYGYQKGCESEGTLLFYNAALNARKFGGANEDVRIDRALDDLNSMYREIQKKAIRDSRNGGPKVETKLFNSRDYYDGDYFVRSWQNQPSTGVSSPVTSEYINYVGALMKGVEGCVFFAGEHLSVHHAWIIGPLYSAAQAIGAMITGHLKRCNSEDLTYFLAHREENTKDSKHHGHFDPFRGNRIPNLDFNTELIGSNDDGGNFMKA